jgi:hypothetical protein
LQNYVDAYHNSNVGGVAGNVVPTKLEKGALYPKNGASEIIPVSMGFLKSFRRNVVDCPLKGLENPMVYIS